MKRATGKKLRPGWTRVTVDIQEKHLAIARAIAAAWTASDPEEPTTVAQVLEGALDEGLISDEKYFLGTCSLDHSDRWWDTREFPKTTLPMLALVRAVSGKAAMIALSRRPTA